ncbi:hypothetical protein GOP47_0000829 [Adiantum capillus-veneris]|uniref:Neprosin PEP catalytic domain-containing protein n=1 Tax=Adiantum capillus-veneris TaxID=13818 RepID=A0A9D4VDQ7_ADICA|nr:hypothetical protein GOP47_0000829 [Adiantum capillus-veneris]
MAAQYSVNDMLVRLPLYMTFLWLAMVLSTSSAFAVSSRVQQHLKRFNKPAISTIESPDGDLIDCILISQQPALDHPLLRDHKIQMQPLYYAKNREDSVVEDKKEGRRGTTEFLGRKFSNHKPAGGHAHVREKGSMNTTGHPQLWHQVGVSCPEGTIPVRRTSESDLRRNTSQMHTYGRKFHHPPEPSAVPAASVDATGHQHAIGYVQGGQYYGAKANINVWNPSVQASNEFSLSQIWILGGSFNNDLNSIEAGWQVSPDLYGDTKTRLFIYWTSDSYQTTGCYNLLCSGFVQVSNDIALGASIAPISSYDNHQYDITILIWKDPKEGNWWMQFGNKYILGYWPAALFTSLSKSASMVEWGGEVVNSQPGGKHTSTQMGSGHFPFESFGKCSYFSHLLIVEASNNLMSASDVNTFAESPTCYNVQTGSSSDWGTYFYYGGPGRNPNCP